MSKFMVLIRTYSVAVKQRRFFVDQGGDREPWGKDWQEVEAHDLEAARRKGLLARDSRPGPCERTWPSRRLRKDHRVNWSGNAGICLNCGTGFTYDEGVVNKALKEPRRRRHNFKAAAARNKKAFASTKSKDGQYPI